MSSLVLSQLGRRRDPLKGAFPALLTTAACSCCQLARHKVSMHGDWPLCMRSDLGLEACYDSGR